MEHNLATRFSDEAGFFVPCHNTATKFKHGYPETKPSPRYGSRAWFNCSSPRRLAPQFVPADDPTPLVRLSEGSVERRLGANNPDASIPELNFTHPTQTTSSAGELLLKPIAQSEK